MDSQTVSTGSCNLHLLMAFTSMEFSNNILGTGRFVDPWLVPYIADMEFLW